MQQNAQDVEKQETSYWKEMVSKEYRKERIEHTLRDFQNEIYACRLLYVPYLWMRMGIRSVPVVLKLKFSKR